MTGETDLSTADLAQPGGTRAQDRTDEHRRTGRADEAGPGSGDRSDETSGTRVAEGRSDDDTVVIPSVATGGGSTRDDALPSDGTYPGSVDAPGADGDVTVRRSDRGTSGTRGAGRDVALLDPADTESFRRRWSDTQARFVDDPREAVRTADALVAELVQTLARSFAQHKGELESHWTGGGDPDTEDLRQALQRYRSFFDRLLSA